MVLPIEINGSTTVVPGVYSTYSVANSAPPPVPATRAVFIFGESEEGVPGSALNLKLNFFTDPNDAKAFYRSGPIVDACRMLLGGNQPSPVFGGAVQRVYVYKTNATTRAEKSISSPSNYGAIVAARYGERGNQIRSQILTGQAESLPSKAALYLPSSAARAFKASANGTLTAAASISGGQVGSDFVTAFGALSGVAASGGDARTVNSATLTITITASADVLTLTKTAGSGTFGTEGQVGDVAYIVPGTATAGTGDANSGSYIVTAWTATTVSLRELKHMESAGEANSEAFDTSAGITMGIGDLLLNAPVSVSVDATTLAGQGASLELFESSADKLAAGMLFNYDDLSNILALSTSSIANVSVTVPSSGKLKIALDKGSWTTTPKAGDIIRIARGSLIAGSTRKNVGLLIVESATSQSVTASHLFSGMTTEAVSSVSLNSTNDVFKWAAGWVSSSVAAIKNDSSAERKAQVSASRTTDGEQFPSGLIGGNPCLEMSYNHGSATACTVSIDSNRIMTIDVTGSSLTDVTINTKKYATLQDLVDFINTQANLSARVTNPLFKSLPTSALDMVTSVGILGGHSLAAYNGRLKKDYYDWKKYFADNFGLLAFREGSMTLKAGLPAAESAAGFLSGGVIGATSNADIQNALDAAMKIDCRMVVPLFSRDCSYDIIDGLTDTGSTYTIDSVHAAVKAHVAGASNDLNRRRREGLLSFDGPFADAKTKAGNLGYERLQMTFQRHNATDGNGNSVKMLPWIASCAVAAGRAQANLGVSMLRKPFLLSSVDHTGDSSLYSDTLTQDFDQDDLQGQVSDAITAGLLVFRQVPGFGVRMESPDLTTRSRIGDTTAFVFERMEVLFAADEIRTTLEAVLDNYIGNRSTDTPTAVVKQTAQDSLNQFVSSKALVSGTVLDIKKTGGTYKAKVRLIHSSTLEAIVLDVESAQQNDA